MADAQTWVNDFVDWYNNKHLHSGIKFVTPSSRHNGEDIAILNRRKVVYETARINNSNHWLGKSRNWDHQKKVYLNDLQKKNEGVKTGHLRSGKLVNYPERFRWWHVLYDEAPALLNCFDDNGNKFLESVLIKLGDKFCLNEKIHIYLIDYIKNNHFDIYTKKIEEKLLNSACILWVRTNTSSFRCIVIYSKGLNIFFVYPSQFTFQVNGGIHPLVNLGTQGLKT